MKAQSWCCGRTYRVCGTSMASRCWFMSSPLNTKSQNRVHTVWFRPCKIIEWITSSMRMKKRWAEESQGPWGRSIIKRQKELLMPWLSILILHLLTPASHVDMSSYPGCSTSNPALCGLRKQQRRGTKTLHPHKRQGISSWLPVLDLLSSGHCDNLGSIPVDRSPLSLCFYFSPCKICL